MASPAIRSALNLLSPRGMGASRSRSKSALSPLRGGGRDGNGDGSGDGNGDGSADGSADGGETSAAGKVTLKAAIHATVATAPLRQYEYPCTRCGYKMRFTPSLTSTMIGTNCPHCQLELRIKLDDAMVVATEGGGCRHQRRSTPRY